ncbi:MAG: hypothetical protein M3N10_06685 [Actinomycetota bacterium]|nr:hypothetical protein [Actinomycetota bacterium]
MKKILLLAALVAATFLAGCDDAGRTGTSTEGSTISATSQQGGSTESAGMGPTEAPDLLSIGEFREGPPWIRASLRRS